MPKDFSSQNLRGRSFKGQDLAGANFSKADIRSTNFIGANLRGANFTDAKAGLQKRWALFLVMLSCFVSGISGFLFLLNGLVIGYIFNSSESIESLIAGWTALILTIIVHIIFIRQGIGVSFVLTLAIAGVIAGAFPVAFSFGLAKDVSFPVAGAAALAFIFIESVVVALALAVTGALAVAAVVVFTIAGFVAGALAVTEVAAGALAVAGVAAGTGTVTSTYVAWRAMKGDETYSLTQNLAVAFAAIGGTSFRSADLTDANFTSARLKSTDFRRAKLTSTCFHKTKLLDRIRPGTSYLKHLYVQQLLTTGRGQDKNFDRLDLRGINLKGAFLTDASLICTDLSEACLQDADLSRAKLVQTQLDATNFTGATLTGAYIEDWNITNQTNFRGVKCEYVYMRLPSKENPDPLRKPDNREEVFADGEFGEFIQPIFDTLDLYLDLAP